jgi:hypothetical protein
MSWPEKVAEALNVAVSRAEMGVPPAQLRVDVGFRDEWVPVAALDTKKMQAKPLRNCREIRREVLVFDAEPVGEVLDDNVVLVRCMPETFRKGDSTDHYKRFPVAGRTLIDCLAAQLVAMGFQVVVGGFGGLVERAPGGGYARAARSNDMWVDCKKHDVLRLFKAP